jgi:predicted nuclease of predicted toxin-antitoxin system
MTLWLDAHLSPRIARWISDTFGFAATAARDLNLRESEDDQIFFAARKADAVVITKDSDFINLLERHGPPPKIIWLTCGNTSEDALKQILSSALPEALKFLEAGDDLVEIGNP